MANRASLDVDIRAHDHVTPTVKQLQSGIIRFVGAITASLAAIQGIAFPIQQAAAFEKEMKNVQKTTNFTEGQIKSLGDALSKMSTELLIGQEELAQIAATAGQLGIGQQGAGAILKFTESVARASSTFDIAADSLSTLSAQILNVFGIPIDNIENVFSAINEVSNNSVASAEKLIDIIKRVGNVAGLTLTQVTALAAQSQDLGVTSEVAGTTLVKQFSRMQSEASKFSEVMSVTTDEWVSRVEDNALQAFRDVTLQISQLETAAKAEAIKELFGGGRIFALASKQVTDAANNFELLDRSLTHARDAFIAGQSSIKEYDIIASSLSGRVSNLGNEFTALARSAGDDLIPVLKDVVLALKTFLGGDQAKAFFDSLSDSMEQAILKISAVVAKLGEYETVWRNLVPVIKTFLALGVGKIILRMVGAFGLAIAQLVLVDKKVRILKGSWASLYDTIIASSVGGAIASSVAGAGARLSGSGIADQAAISSKEASDQKRLSSAVQLEARYAGQTAQLQKQVIIEGQLNAATAQRSAELGKTIAFKDRMLASDLRRGEITIAEAVQRKKELADLVAEKAVLDTQLATQTASLVNSKSQLTALSSRLALQREILATQGLQTIAIGAQNTALSQQQVLIGEILAADAVLATGRAGFGATAAGTGAALAVGSKAVKDYSAAAVGARLATVSLGGVIKKIGGYVLRFITGPWGAAAITLGIIFASFKTEIISFLGFVQDVEEDAKKRRIRATERESREKLRAAVEVYEKGLNAAEFDPVKVQIRLDSNDEDISNLAKEEVEAATKNLSEGITGLNAKATLSAQAFEEWEGPIKKANRELADFDKKIASSQRRLEVSQVINAPTDGSSERIERDIADLQAERLERAKQLAVYLDLQTAEDEEQLQIATERAELEKKLQAALLLRNKKVTNQLFNAAEGLTKVNEEIEAQARLREELEKVKKERAALDFTISEQDGDPTDKQANKLQELNQVVADAEVAAKKSADGLDVLRTAYGALADRVEFGTEPALLKTLESLPKAGAEAFVAANKIAFLEGKFLDTSEAFAAGVPIVKAASAEIARLSGQLSKFSSGRVIVDALAGSVKGLADNLVATTAAATRAIRTMIDDTAELNEQATQDAQLEEDIATDPRILQIESREKAKIARLEERKTAHIKARQPITAALLDQEIEAAKREAETNRAAVEADIRVVALKRDINEQSAKRGVIEKGLTDAENAHTKALEKQKALQVSGSEKDSPALIAAGEEVAKASLALDAQRAKVTDLQQAITAMYAEFQRLAKTQKVNLSGQFEPIVTPEAQKTYGESIEKIINHLNVLNNRATLTVQSALQETLLTFDAIEKKLLGFQTLEIAKIVSVVGKGAAAEVADLSRKVGVLKDAVNEVPAYIDTLGQLDQAINDLPALVKKFDLKDITLTPIDVQIKAIELSEGQFRNDVNALLGNDPIYANIAAKEDALKTSMEDGLEAGGPYKIVVEPVTRDGKAFTADIGGRASGGLIRGPGTGTSDSILARLSNNEYVIRAAAVQKYGVGLFDALNSTRASSIPKFAGGGLAKVVQGGSGGADVNLNINMGGKRVSLRGEKDQVEAFVTMLSSVEGQL